MQRLDEMRRKVINERIKWNEMEYINKLIKYFYI
jgi:hypothetical protein